MMLNPPLTPGTSELPLSLTPKPVLLSPNDFVPQAIFGNVWGLFWWPQLSGRDTKHLTPHETAPTAALPSPKCQRCRG